jgi:hypothetical protein
MSTVVVNYANGDWYPKGQERLKNELLKFKYYNDFLLFNNIKQFKGEEHKDNPYAFKVQSIRYALNQGHEVVWYMDSSIYPVKPISPCFNEMLKLGYVFEEAGHKVGNWANDKCLEYFNLTRDEAMTIPLFSAGFMLLDFRREIVVDFFNQLEQSCKDGIFKGAWTNANDSESLDSRCFGHRHDMVCASIIAYKLGMVLQKGGTFLCYVGDAYGTPSESAIFHLHPC